MNQATILAVDDTPESLALLLKILTPAGYKVRPADSGELALAAVVASPPDLILLDVRMPDIDGLEVCRRLKARQATQHIPIILISAFADVKEWVEGLRLGAADYITKPFQAEELLTRVGTHLALHRAALSLEEQSALLRETNERLQSEIVERQQVEEELRQRVEQGERSRRALLGALEGQKRTGRELQEAKQLVEAVVENVPLMIFLKEVQDLRFVVFNRAGEDLLGYDRKDLLGKNNLDLFPPEQAAFFMAKDREVLAGNVLVDIPEEPILTAKKGERLLHTRKVCIKGADGVTKYLLGISEDITERKQAEAKRQQLEEQLRGSQKMEAIGSLAGGIAHDFNNLLSVILTYTVFAMEGVREGDPLKDDLLEVKKAADRAATLTRQLLAFSRKQVLQPVSLCLNEIALGLEKMLRRILGEDIDYAQALAPELGVVQADPGQMEQVLMNLVVNARDAMPGGGKLTIETANVEIDEEYAARHVAVKPGPYVQLVVTDTGCGMDRETRDRLFEPFFTTKEKGRGTGLGLPMVYGIVKQSGGNIWVYSEPGQGTTFKIYLPRDLAATTATALKPRVVPGRTTGTETILVVEDEEALLKVAQRALDAAGYTVLAASDGDEALQISAEHVGEIHLLLTDVVMPRMSGRAVAQELARTRPGLKSVYMSGYTDDAIVHHGVLDAGTHFLAKPFTAADLMRKVREVLDEGITNGVDEHLHAIEPDPGLGPPPVS